MQLTLIRHLPTPWNEKGILQGKKDILINNLNKASTQEISANKQFLKHKSPFSLVLVSTLKRTHQTAMAYDFDYFQIEPLLDELDFGKFEGKEKRCLIEEHGEKWLNTPRDLILGESLLHLEKRVIRFIEKYRNYDSLLVFGHGSWIRACVSYYRYGTINNMNQMVVKNNQLLSVNVDNVDNVGNREEEVQIGHDYL
ncbi:histidine phosphatase family protein [Fredinandcohnia sp. 179-A 10B2 NHS]|uniref:histidine phosphatase family protein n=1 Tax=Fredinandcohnia sp. 179-A 10B2 NHS TaxID=3235176 RepID=UPI0039A34CF2